ncbi:MAG: carbohydrate-binding family 9-like protein, partial [Candidatus Aminicenantales bacterium]
MRRSSLLIAGLLLVPAVFSAIPSVQIAEPKTAFAPFEYVCRRAAGPLKIDGRLDEASWADSDWTEVFGDIEGPAKSAPRFRTRVQMLWDDRYFYIGAYLEEPHVWATLKDRDSIIFQDNDFEVFIDPDGDTHDYYEL